MTYQEKKSVVNFVSAILVPAAYFLIYIPDLSPTGLTTDELLLFWGKTMMIYIPVAIVTRIIILVLFGISVSIISNEKDPGTDERDKIIELKAKNAGQVIFALGLIASMATLAMGMHLSYFFINFLIGGVLSELLENSLQFYYYRKGF